MNMIDSFIIPIVTIIGFIMIISWVNKKRVKINEEIQEIKTASEYPWTNDPWSNDDPEKSIFDLDLIEVPDPLNKDLEAYKKLFEAKTDYLEEMINKKFKKHTISWNKYNDLIEKSRTTFDEEIDSANKMWELDILINKSEISEMYNEKIENINKIIEEIEGLMIEFIKSEYKPDGDNLKRLLEEIDYCKQGVDMYVEE